ncbi:Chorion class CA protein ERA.5, partial [Frankliniella fusca]
DNSPYGVCFGARSAMELLEQRGGQLFRGRRPWRTSGGMNRGRGYARGFNNRGRWNGVRGACGGRFRGFVRGRGNGRGNSSRSHQFIEGSHDGGFNELTEQCNDDEKMEILTSGSKAVQGKCPVIGNVSFVGDSFALRMCQANIGNVTDKRKSKFMCERGLTMNEMKSRLEKCDANDFKTKNIVMFMGMNDLRKHFWLVQVVTFF